LRHPRVQHIVQHRWRSTVLYDTALHCTVITAFHTYCIVLCCTVLYVAAQHNTIATCNVVFVECLLRNDVFAPWAKTTFREVTPQILGLDVQLTAAICCAAQHDDAQRSTVAI
jgi:hypothetical protein